MRLSIKKQLSFIFTGLVAGTILLCWFANVMFLGKFYILNKEKALKLIYVTLNNSISTNTYGNESAVSNLEFLCEKYNVNIVVLNENSQIVMASINDTNKMRDQLWNYIFEYMPELDMSDDRYQIVRGIDRYNKTEYIEMWGLLENGHTFLLRTAVESIQDSVGLSNKFLGFVGLIAILANSLVISFVSKKISKPISELSTISEQMNQLNFEVKYTGKGNNEIDLLGKNINSLSATLEDTISELKKANNELQNDIEKKEKTDIMRKEFLSNVSHELKTPIALIQGYAEGLKEGISDDEESRDFYCDVIIDESGKMNRMVKNLLDLNQLEFGNDMVEMERFDLNELIHNYIQSAEILTKPEGIQVVIDRNVPLYVWGDEFKVEEVIRNYFSNALNHISGEKVIRIRFTEHDDITRVSFFNTGVPIPEESLEHIWEKFYKVDKARTREYGGSGVGLSIVKAIMEAMNQNYGVCNYDDGVEFWFELKMK